MTIKQMIKKAKNVWAYVILYENEGEYILVKKSWFINSSQEEINKLDKNKFVLRDDGDLYIN
jgi:hypothetical protein